MKKQIDLQLLAVLIGGVIFNYLFWMEEQALNLLLYSLFIIVILLLDKEMPKSKKILLIGGSHLLAAILVLINQSDLTIISWYISLAVFIGFAHFQSLRSIFTALIGTFLQIVTVPVNLFRKLVAGRYSNVSFTPILKPIKYLVIPIIVLFLFSILYSIANPVFAKYLDNMITAIESALTSFFNFFFDELSFLRFMHFILGLLLATAIFIGFKDKALEGAEALYTDKLLRQRKSKGAFTIGYEIIAVFAGNLLNRKMALKTENIIGIISFTALNLLLLFLNAIDINTLWTAKTTGSNLSSELHDGTNALIISIVMAMLVIVYFFSGNLNFYSKNKILRLLAYIWIIQNAFLVLSVLLRDYNYIDAYGLTYKRIGVMIFLLLCTIGLVTVYLKVAQQKTLFYLIRINSFIWYILLLTFGMVNWDVFIVGYNINNRGSIALDLDHLTSLSDKTLPLLHKNKTLLLSYLSTSKYADSIIQGKSPDTIMSRAQSAADQVQAFESDLKSRIIEFKQTYANASWLSWNYRDWQTHQYLIMQHL
ncbi:DUF4153 domain-containing protein [Pedobacter psychroterrae]|uniref:DUF4173 domain-containing protein n=1 Tax=Pedobacter psychroterrae TaxID=2530453 RepID=A0A4V2MKX4_9SPHI|nr:DUF4173 domain-containing protein [Pedobacter psychroterrae]TCC99846.1 DUF4173 domain-containing protein [Pedobacter psychroterrae]